MNEAGGGVGWRRGVLVAHLCCCIGIFNYLVLGLYLLFPPFFLFEIFSFTIK